MIGLRQVGSKVLSKQLRLRPAQRRRFCQLYTAEFTHPGHGKSEKREQPKAAKGSQKAIAIHGQGGDVAKPEAS